MIVILYVRGDQIDQLRESHFRKQQSLRGMFYSSKSNHQDIFLEVFLLVSSWYQKKVNMKMKTKDLIKSGKKSLCLWK
jgi:hypothetical protein